MDLVIHHALGSSSSRYNSFAYILNKTLSSQRTVQEATNTTFLLQPSTSFSTYSAQLTLHTEGKFTLDSKSKKILSNQEQLTRLKLDRKTDS